jgi:ParB family chromosome partitioning protein
MPLRTLLSNQANGAYLLRDSSPSRACPDRERLEERTRVEAGAVQHGHFREIETVEENPDAEPAPPCAAAKPAIIVYGKRVGTTLTVCTDDDCPVHDQRAAAELAANPAPTMAPAADAETKEKAKERQRNYEQQRKEYEQEQEGKADERKQQFEREQKVHEAERARREKWHKARVSRFDRIIDKAPAMFSS